ncbi:MAG TPA: monovalent cation/H(+) antiporter subunit G [Caulobacterales bacterium]|nr:monovalent cation/H(+) antiporter subunit G [Caulobacterales bacterium]
MNAAPIAIALDDVRLLIGAALLAAGGLILLIAAIGQARLPDLYARLHTLTPSYTWGGALVLAALAIGAWDGRFGLRVLVLAVLLAIVGPALSHMLANAAHAAGLAPRVGKLDAEDAP